MKTVLIVNLNDTGNEVEALRQVLERFDYFVCVKNIGRPNDFIEVLQNHMPVLADFVYSDNEPRDDFSSTEIERYLKLSGKTVISLGCTTGCEKLAKAFSKNNVYIAPNGYIEGNAALFFILRLFYEMASNDTDIKSSYITARETDSETRQFCMFENGIVRE